MALIEKFRKGSKILEIRLDLDPLNPMEEYDCCEGKEDPIFQAYANGEVYGFVLYTSHICETCKQRDDKIEDSCWGFYGQSGIDQIKEELGIDSSWEEID